ncbi:hypothetical protein OKW20_000853 [Ensifer sp. LBL]
MRSILMLLMVASGTALAVPTQVMAGGGDRYTNFAACEQNPIQDGKFGGDGYNSALDACMKGNGYRLKVECGSKRDSDCYERGFFWWLGL